MPSTSTDRLQGLTTSVAVKAPCKAVTTTTITLNGEQTVGGVACVTGDRVLVAISGGSVNNGIWVVDTGDWSRARDFDGSRDVVKGTFVLVAPGTSNAELWAVYGPADTIVIGSSVIDIRAAGGDAATILLDLASTASATKGLGQTGFSYYLAYALGTGGHALKQNRIDVRLLGVDNTGATDASAAMAAALALGIPLAMRGTFKLLSTVTYTGKVDILGENCQINSDVTCFEITDGDGSRIRNLKLMPITTPYTLLRNTSSWPNMVAGDVVQSLEGYQPSSQDTDIWASLSAGIQAQSANQTIRNGIVFLSSTGLTARKDVQISGITGRAVFIQLQGYSDSVVDGCDFGAGPREGINFLNGQTLARGARNRISNNKVRYASQCGILWWAQDDLTCYGNDSRLNGESGFKSYQYDGTNTTDVISKRCRVFGNHSQDNYYDGFDLQVWYNVTDPGVYTANQVFGNVSKNHRHTCYTINGEGDDITANHAELAGSHGISVKSKRASVTGNKAVNCAQLPGIHGFQIFDILLQGDGISSIGNRVDNATAAYTYNYLHSGVNGADPTTGDEGIDSGNSCSGGPGCLALSKNIPIYLITSVVKSITTDTYTVSGTDSAVSFFTSATCTVTLPNPAKYPGRVLSFRNTAAFAINSASSNVSPIGGGALTSAILPATVGKWCELQSDGTNWLAMSSN